MPIPTVAPAPEVVNFFGWKNLGLLFGVYLFAVGFVYYSFNVIFPEMVRESGWKRGEASWAQTLHGLCFAAFVPLAALTTNRIGARRTIVVGVSVLIAGCILLGTITDSIFAWTLLWGVVMAFGFAFGGVIPIQTTVAQWFSLRRATAIGVVMSAAGLGGFLAQPLFTWVMQAFGGWQAGWLVATGFAGIAICLAGWVINHPDDRGEHADGIAPGTVAYVQHSGARGIYRTQETWTLADALRTPTLWLLIVLFLGTVMPLYLLLVHGILHLTDLDYDRMQAASVLSFMLGGSACARFPIGWLGDRLEPRLLLFGLLTAAAIALGLVWQAPGLGWLLLAGVLFGAAYGGTLVLVPAVIANYFGAASFASINGFVFPVQLVIASAVPVGAGYLADLTGSYDTSFIGLTGFTILAAVCALATRPPRRLTPAENP
ncbi:MAG: hypothetical protein CMK33_01030 [Porticoccaceae bacterium]|nr:hypothetical protein [Porticoccaceae bacterium]